MPYHDRCHPPVPGRLSARSRPREALAALAGAVLALAAVTTLGCQEVNTRNDPAFVQAADTFVNRTVGPEYEIYVRNDPALGPVGEITPARESRLQNVASFRDAVGQALLETAETGGATP